LSSDLLYHGYDPTLSFPIWGNLTFRGHSQSIWGRAVGWTSTGLLTTLNAIPNVPATATVRKQLEGIFAQLMSAIVEAQDEYSGAWWQVMDFPGRQGNFLESSATGLFAYSILRGLRLGYIGTEESRINANDRFHAQKYKDSAERAYNWLLNSAVLDLGDGTLGYNLTVDVCSVNSTTEFDVSKLFYFIVIYSIIFAFYICVLYIFANTVQQFYVNQPLKPQGLLGEVGFLLTDMEMQLAEN
jgi:rhamnogalacturonyl hydrolase YesR